MGEFLLSIWTYFATNILTQPAYLIGFSQPKKSVKNLLKQSGTKKTSKGRN
ncbi:hypothetical protein [Enterococcus faecium]|uniref:hypothetical protein n=1 Tax=Enterococcus faecium TaxID=1352 RepID=UPI001558D6BB|nr:hypothetical protein [Enterococcus faecium]EGP5570102.1 hypothetical protein [Enterococcus faecium]EME7179979.1 hypothetical protein [Enterococcus faecium]EME8173326.1 hypothetical protein [Enterococcus faecium]EMF0416309.1 hypothetical protein [Enterococcus faecium]EMF0610152.1 hypothetical protein [Enterococcus faecium]